MDLAVFDATELPLVARALKGIAAAKGALAHPERQLLEVVADLHGASLDVDALAPIEPAALACAVTDPHRRKRLVQLALVMAMADGDVTPPEEAAVAALANALGVPEEGLAVLHDLVRGSALLTRFDLLRRMVPRFVGAAYAEEGIAGLRKFLAPVLNTGEDPEIAWRYKQLGLLSQGTFGRAFWEHMTARKFTLPGERGGIPERMVFHDFGHVLSGYDTDAEGEIQQGAFQAGFMRTDGFVFLCFVIVQFHLGIQITPVAKPQKGLFDVPKVMRAAARGAACKVDLSRGWSPWEVVERPLSEVRALYGIA